MICLININSLFDKEIISIVDGARMGDIKDIQFNETTGEITALIISGKFRLFGFFGRKERSVVPWKNVRVIGEETILVDSFIQEENKKESKSIIKAFLS